MNDTFHFHTKITKVGSYNFPTPTKRERFLGYPLVAGVVACIFSFNNNTQRFAALGSLLAAATTTQFVTKKGPPPTTFLTPTTTFGPMELEEREEGERKGGEEDYNSPGSASASVLKGLLRNLKEEQDIWPTGEMVERGVEERVFEVWRQVGWDKKVRMYERMGPYEWGGVDGKDGIVLGIPEIWKCKTPGEVKEMCKKYTPSADNSPKSRYEPSVSFSSRDDVWEAVFENSTSFSSANPPPPTAAPVSKEQVVEKLLPSEEEQKFLLALTMLEVKALSSPITLFLSSLSLPLMVVGFGGLMSICIASTLSPVPLFLVWMSGTNALTYLCTKMGSDYRIKAQKQAIHLYPQGAREYAERTIKVDDFLYPGTYNLQKYMALLGKKQFDQRRQVVTEENDVRKNEAKRLKRKIEPEKPRMRGWGEESRWLTMYYRPFMMFEEELVKVDPTYTPTYYKK